jgi:hypothetical protein
VKCPAGVEGQCMGLARPSPDGRKLALGRYGVLRIFQFPVLAATSPALDVCL